MATPIEKLLIEIKADTKQLTASLNKTKQQLGKTEEKSKALGNSLKVLGTAVAAIGFGRLLSQTIQTVREFEDLEATLRAVTGSAENAKNSFALIRAFTSTTTFQIQEVASAFIRLKQAGIVPTSEVLQDFGNLAAGMGRSIEQLAQAAFNATTGEMEMLKQFGVVARLEGDKIRATFDGVTTEMDRSGESITNFLRQIGRENFSDALEQRAKTLTGAISNLKDATSEFMVSVGEGGLRTALAEVALEMKDVLMNNRQLATDLGQVLGGAVKVLAGTLRFLLENINLVAGALAFLVGSSVAGAVVTMIPKVTRVFRDLRNIIRGTTTASIVLQGATGIGIAKVATGLAAAGLMINQMNKILADSSEVADDVTQSMKELDDELELGLKQNVKVIDQVSEGTKRLSKAIMGLPKGKFTIFDSLMEMNQSGATIGEFLADRQQTIFDEMIENLGTSSSNKTLLNAINEMVDKGFFENFEKALSSPQGAQNMQVALFGNLKRALLDDGFKKEDVDEIVQDFYTKMSEGLNEDGEITTSAEMVSAFLTKVMDQASTMVQTERDNFYQKLFGPKATEEFFNKNIIPVIDVPNIEQVIPAVDKLARTNLMPTTIKELQRVMSDPNAFAGFVNLSKHLDQFIGLTDKQIRDALEQYIDTAEDAQEVDPFAGLTGLEGFMADALRDAVQGTDALKKSFEDLDDTEIEVYIDGFADILDKLGISAETAKDLLTDLRDGMDDTASTFSDELAVAVQQASMAFTRDFVEGLEEAGDAMDAFESLAANIVKQIITIFLQLAIVNKIINSIFGTNYQQMDITGDNAFQVYTPDNASGGRISGPSIVGERGPELFIPDTTGVIRNHADSKSMMRGQAINIYQNVNFATGVQSTVRAEVVKMLPQIAEVSKSAVADASGRGGSYRRTLLGG